MNLKKDINRSITPENIDNMLKDEDIFNGLIKIFNAKDFYNRSLFGLETYLGSA